MKGVIRLQVGWRDAQGDSVMILTRSPTRLFSAIEFQSGVDRKGALHCFDSQKSFSTLLLYS